MRSMKYETRKDHCNPVKIDKNRRGLRLRNEPKRTSSFHSSRRLIAFRARAPETLSPVIPFVNLSLRSGHLGQPDIGSWCPDAASGLLEDGQAVTQVAWTHWPQADRSRSGPCGRARAVVC